VEAFIVMNSRGPKDLYNWVHEQIILVFVESHFHIVLDFVQQFYIIQIFEFNLDDVFFLPRFLLEE